MIEEISTPEKPAPLESGFEWLESAIGFIRPGEVCMIASRSSNGKSAFALQIAVNRAVHGCLVHHFSFEQNAGETIQRAVTQLEGGKLIASAFDESRFLIDDREGTLAMIRRRLLVRHLPSSIHKRFIVIDRLQAVRIPRGSQLETIQAETEFNLSAIRELAREFGAYAIVTAEIKGGGRDERPDLSHLTEAGNWSRDCTKVVFLHSPHETGGNAAEIKIAFQHEDRLADWEPLIFNRKMIRFEKPKAGE